MENETFLTTLGGSLRSNARAIPSKATRAAIMIKGSLSPPNWTVIPAKGAPAKTPNEMASMMSFDSSIFDLQVIAMDIFFPRTSLSGNKSAIIAIPAVELADDAIPSRFRTSNEKNDLDKFWPIIKFHNVLQTQKVE